MPKFIPLSTFKKLYNSNSELLNESRMNDFRAKLESAETQKIKRDSNISDDDFKRFKKSLEKPTVILFYGWIEQNKALSEMLSVNIAIKKYEDKTGNLKHRLAQEFKSFLSPFLTDSLMKFTEEKDDSKRSIAFSYTKLLDIDHQALVEAQLFKKIQNEIKQLKQSVDKLTNEKELIDIVTPLCNDHYLDCVNQLSKASYALKLEYVDELLNCVKSKACTARFANWILKKLEVVKMNVEHQSKIVDLRKELEEGIIQVRNRGEGKTPIRWARIFAYLFMLASAFVIFYIIYYQPFNEVDVAKFTNNSSFKQFTKEERKKIDSLLQEMNGNAKAQDIVYDQGIPILGGGSATLRFRREFDNKTMERVYDDLNKDANLKEKGFVDSCDSEIAYRTLEGVRDLDESQGNIEAVIRNESEYEAILFVAENKLGGKTYSKLLKSGETIVFEMDKFNTIMVVAGTTYQNYTAPSGAISDELPSSKYTCHFCETDVNYKESINTAYKLVHLKKGKTKFMIMGDKGSYFHLIDVHGVLEPF